eukprot:g31094.t1
MGQGTSTIPYEGEDQIVIFGGQDSWGDFTPANYLFRNDVWAYSVLYDFWTYIVPTGGSGEAPTSRYAVGKLWCWRCVEVGLGVFIWCTHSDDYHIHNLYKSHRHHDFTDHNISNFLIDIQHLHDHFKLFLEQLFLEQLFLKQLFLKLKQQFNHHKFHNLQLHQQ